jgi:hypothetical protein
MTPIPDTEPPAAETPAPKKNDAKVGLIAAGVIIVAVFGCVGLLAWNKNGNPPDSDNGVGAERVCRDFVKDRLKSPSSAKFSGLAHDNSGTGFVVTGNVDSQNSFGAMVRNSFTCDVRLDGDTWRLTSLTGLEN